MVFLRSSLNSNSFLASIQSIAFTGSGEIEELHKISNWLTKFLSSKKSDILRSKAIMSLKGKPKKYIYLIPSAHLTFFFRFIMQGIHENFEIHEHTLWSQEKRINKFIFIGKNLNPKEIMDSLKSEIGLELIMEIKEQQQQPPSGRELFYFILVILVIIYFSEFKQFIISLFY
jgi:G3E family GTPase